MPPRDPRARLARDWLARAERDLRLARLAISDPALAGLTAFHCQQAAEKALKAFLTWRDQPLPRTHDLPALLARCRAHDLAFAVLQAAVRTLDVYLTAGRYPDAGPEPSTAEAEQALQLAAQTIAFVAEHLPPEPP